jgi:hypothetical protein
VTKLRIAEPEFALVVAAPPLLLLQEDSGTVAIVVRVAMKFPSIRRHQFYNSLMGGIDIVRTTVEKQTERRTRR